MAFAKVVRSRSVALFLLALCLSAIPAVQGDRISRAEKPAERNRSEIIEGLTSPDPVRRAATVQTIRITRNTAAVPALVGQLSDSDQRVGLYVAQALGELATLETLPELRSALRHPNPAVRWRAALALGELGDARAVSVLAQALRDPDVLVQRTAAQALAQIGNEAAANALVAALGSPQPSVTYAAMNGLQDLGEPAVLPLTRALASDKALLRLNAATVLGYIASPQALPALQLATADPDPAVRAEVAWALAQIQNKK